jgi:8-oxo-dGTP pyrophosphatase MutT (NUDIX family)
MADTDIDWHNDNILSTDGIATLADRLRERLAQDLPGADAQADMAPRYDARRESLSVRGRDCREAGVLALLYPNEEPHLVLTVRRDDLPDHPGQISFPGGQREPGETLPETALREAQEEVDLPPSDVHLVGALTPLFVPPSNFCVHPFVGVTSEIPVLTPTDREVGDILHIPVRTLLLPDTRVVDTWTLHGREIDVPYYRVGEHVVWGATAMMLAELLFCLRDITDPFPE